MEKMRRTACLRESENYFYFAVKPPFEPGEHRQGLLNLAYALHRLEDNTEVIVFDRMLFGNEEKHQRSHFLHWAKDFSAEAGNLALQKYLQKIK